VVPKVLTCITAVYNVYCMHDTITTVSLLENGPLVAASYLSGSREYISNDRVYARARIRYANNKMGGALTVHDRTAKSPRVSVASFPGAQKSGRGVPGIHDFQENLETCSTVHVAQPYIMQSQESIVTRLATV